MNGQETVVVYRHGNPQWQPSHDHLAMLVHKETTRLGLKESLDDAKTRLDRYTQLRAALDELTNEYRKRKEAKLMAQLTEWIAAPYPEKDESYLRTSLLLCVRPDLVSELSKKPNWKVATIHSGECPNLKTALKRIVNRYLDSDDGSAELRFDGRLTYDFELLASIKADRFVVYLEDAESFDLETICGLFTYMQAYPQLPLHLILGLSTPLEVFEDRLLRANVAGTDSRSFLASTHTAEFLPDCSKLLSRRGANLGSDLGAQLSSMKVHDMSRCIGYALLSRCICGPLDRIEINDTKAHKSSFNPTYRAAIEAQLEDSLFVLKGTSKYTIPLSVLYEIIRESSMYINIYDMFTSFQRTMDVDPRQAMAWFLEGVCELKLLGVIRDCKRKFECVEKVSWKDV